MSWKKVFEFQSYHFLFMVISGISFVFIFQISGLLDGMFFGLSTLFWIVLGISLDFVHHIYVWICWRLQLYYKTFTRKFGNKGFILYVVGFMILFITRILSVWFVSISNSGSLIGNPVLYYVIAAFISVPMLYSFYSVLRFFGLLRATGEDHFDESYRKKSIVKKGIYKYTKNGMYLFAFLIVWIPGLLFSSVSGLLLALLNHIHVWIHYFTVEKPDMTQIYGKNIEK